MKIGLALSGGGTRAIVFHLGLLKALAEKGLWSDITYLSTVSGGSLCVALVMACNANAWPDEETFLNNTLPRIQKMLTAPQWKAIQTYLFWLGLLFTGVRANFLAFLLEKLWGIKGDLSELPETPRWAINCTCWDTGKNWRFERRRMGDYKTQYVLSPHFPIAKAVAASAGVPWLIGSLKIKTSQFQWHKFERDQKTTTPVHPIYKHLSLWDGGLYDNAGIECFFSPNDRKAPKDWLKKDIDFCIISDASKELVNINRKYILWMPLPKWLNSRIADIATDQVRSVRSRWMFQYFRENKNGIYIRMGEGEKYGCKLEDEALAKINSFNTSLMNFKSDDFNYLFNHAYSLTLRRLKSEIQNN